MPTPLIATNAIIKVGSETVALARSVKITVEYETLKEYAFGSETPAVIAKTKKNVSFSFERLLADDMLLQKIESETPTTLSILPEGEGSGKPVWNLIDALFTSLDRSLEYGEAAIESAEGVAKDFQTGTQQ